MVVGKHLQNPPLKFEAEFNKAQEEKYVKKLAEIEAGEDKEEIMLRITAMNSRKNTSERN